MSSVSDSGLFNNRQTQFSLDPTQVNSIEKKPIDESQEKSEADSKIVNPSETEKIKLERNWSWNQPILSHQTVLKIGMVFTAVVFIGLAYSITTEIKNLQHQVETLQAKLNFQQKYCTTMINAITILALT